MFENHILLLNKLLSESGIQFGKKADISRLSYNTFFYKIVFAFGNPGGGSGRGPLPGYGDEEWQSDIELDEIMDIIIHGVDIPLIEIKSYMEDIRKYGKTDKGRESQVDIDRTLERKLERLVIEYGSYEEAILKLLSDPFADDDFVYNRFEVYKKSAYSNRYAFIMDLSGSMQDQKIAIDKSLFYIFLRGLSQKFDYINIFMGAHQVGEWTATIENLNMKKFMENEYVIEYIRLGGGGGTSVKSVFSKVEEWSQDAPYVLFYSGDFGLPSKELEYIPNFLNKDNVGFYTIIAHTGHLNTNLYNTKKGSIIIDRSGSGLLKDPVDFIRFAAMRLSKPGVHVYEG